jgi:hypothetical protein
VVALLKRRRDEVPPAPPEPAATVAVHPDALESIAATAGSVDSETGGPLIGTVQPSWHPEGRRLIVSILATVSPGPGLRASHASVRLGQPGDGERAASGLRWWRSVTGLDLRHLGDWHKHPSGLAAPSGGDRATARRIRSETASPVWLTAIAVGGHEQRRNVAAADHQIRLRGCSDSWDEICFYRETGRLGLAPVRVFVEALAIPSLPPLPWHVLDPVRFSAECRLLHAGGFAIEIEPSAAEPLGLALRLRDDSRPAVTLITGPSYPSTAPLLFDDRGRRIPIRGDWSSTRFLIDAAKQAAAVGGRTGGEAGPRFGRG